MASTVSPRRRGRCRRAAPPAATARHPRTMRAIAAPTGPPLGSTSRSDQPRDLGRGHEHVGEVGIDGIGGAHRLAGQPQVDADRARRIRQQPRAADVGDQADARLRHGEPRALGDDAVAGVAGEADAAAHDDAVLDGDVGLGVAADQRVEPVLLAPERARSRPIPARGCRRARARRRRRTAPGRRRRRAGRGSTAGSSFQASSASQIWRTIAVGQRVERLRPVHGDAPRPALTADQDLVSWPRLAWRSLDFPLDLGISHRIAGRMRRAGRSRPAVKGSSLAAMTVWQKISGLATAVGDAGGSLLGGLGRALGLDRARSEPQKDVAFTIAVVALSAKMAKADGVVSPLELDAFTEVFRYAPEEAAQCRACVQSGQAGRGRLRGLRRPDRDAAQGRPQAPAARARGPDVRGRRRRRPASEGGRVSQVASPPGSASPTASSASSAPASSLTTAIPTTRCASAPTPPTPRSRRSTASSCATTIPTG